MSKKKSLVKNAASEKQVKKAEKVEVSKRDQQLNDLRSVLNTPSGRRVIWRFLEKCRVFNTIWEASAKIHYNSGQQDIGHYIMSEIVDADERFLLEMMKENKKETMHV
jgi:hypothetical protein